MDPLGFGLENFDAVGAWRTTDGKFPIDAKGFLPDGDTFNGPDELRGVLDSQREVFARCLTTKLLTYALGRGLERYDTRTVKDIAGRLPASKYRFSALVLEIVNSLPFQSRKPWPELRATRTSDSDVRPASGAGHAGVPASERAGGAGGAKLPGQKQRGSQ
jgi:hypothetical protein